MAHLWASLRVAVQRLRISRTRKRRVSRIRVIERRKRVCSWIAAPTSACCSPTLRKELKQMLRVRYRSSRSSSSSANVGATSKSGGTGSDIALFSSGDDDESNAVTAADLGGNWLDHDVIERVPLVPGRPRELNCSSLPFDSNNMEHESSAPDWASFDIDSPDWEKTILVNSVSMRPGVWPGDPTFSSHSHFPQRRWESRDWRSSYTSPRLVQSVRWRVATLSGLLRTMSDRYARRRGKATPMHDKRRMQPLAKCVSASQLTRPTDRGSAAAKSARAADLAMRRYDNPYQEFLKQTIEERNKRLVKIKAVVAKVGKTEDYSTSCKNEAPPL